jgi:glycosyltransferase involved in cell wall biosynthesis
MTSPPNSRFEDAKHGNVKTVPGCLKKRALPLLIIGPLPPPRSGVSIHIQRLSRDLRGRGIEHAILDESRTPTEGIPNLHRMSPLAYLRMLRKAGLIHIHTSNRYVRLAHTVAARLMGARVLHTVHGHHEKFLPRISLRLACWLGHESIAVSNAVAIEIGLPAKIIPAFIGPGPEDEIIPADVAAWISRQKAARRKVVAMNAYRPRKIDGVDLYGIDMLIDTFARPDVKSAFAALICVANIDQDAPYFEFLKERLCAGGLSDLVRLRSGEIEFCGVLKRCDVFVRPTITDGDAVSIREALWYGIPTIASDAVRRPSGVVAFKARDVEEFGSALLAHSRGTDRQRRLQRQGYGSDVVLICERLLGEAMGR